MIEGLLNATLSAFKSKFEFCSRRAAWCGVVAAIDATPRFRIQALKVRSARHLSPPPFERGSAFGLLALAYLETRISWSFVPLLNAGLGRLVVLMWRCATIKPFISRPPSLTIIG
jgi:hypothetical protein